MFLKLLLVFLVVHVSLVCNASVETNFVAAHSSKLKILHNFEDIARALVDCPADKKGIIIGYYPIDPSPKTALTMVDLVDRYSNLFDVYFQSGEEDSWKFLVYGKKTALRPATINTVNARMLDNNVQSISLW